jgi:hypothetical protein
MDVVSLLVSQHGTALRVQMLAVAEGDCNFAGGAWDPSDSSRLATIAGNKVQVMACSGLMCGRGTTQSCGCHPSFCT